MTHDTLSLPRWDMTPIFPGPDSPEFVAAFEAALRALAELADLFDARAVGRRDPSTLDAEAAVTAEEVINRYNEVQDAVALIDTYLQCLVAADATHARAQAALSALQQQTVGLAYLAARFVAWVGSLPIDDLIQRSAVAREHAFALRLAQRAAAHLMSPAEEELAAELGPTGASAWYRLRQDVESRLAIRLELDGEERTLPISEAMNLAMHPDREVRRRAHEAEREAWRSVEVPLAAALNGVKGETLTLTGRRSWADPLDAALFRNRIDRATLDALVEAIRAAVPDYRRYLRAKARALGLPVLASYDLLAPVGAHARPWPFDEASAFVLEQFRGYSPKLVALAERAVAERWVDAEPRTGKEGGGFCADVGGGRSRILLNYAPTYLWLSALAHELGHAYHNAVRHEVGRSWLQRRFLAPMTLAETASTFCETLVNRAALAQSDGDDQLAILGGALLSIAANVFGAIAAFDIEQELFAARRRRELSVTELGELVLVAQRDLYGDAVDPETLVPDGWAAAPHPFLPDAWYYNFPYAFGMLFGLGLHARHAADPEAFRPAFDELLSRTGMEEAAELAGRMGIDLRSPDFWREGLDTVRADVDRFEALVVALAPPASNRL
jgi:pepF/M3 family oligoendopeptidase